MHSEHIFFVAKQDVLQQPVMLILNQVAVQKGIAIKSLQGARPLSDISETNAGLLNAVLYEFSQKNRSPV